jgi:Tfp pilus assembly protein PilV
MVFTIPQIGHIAVAAIKTKLLEMRGLLTAGLIVVVCVLGFMTMSQSKQIAELRNIHTGEAAQPVAANLDLQAKCARQAAVMFHELGYTMDDSDYVNHYNMKLGRCFMQISKTKMAGTSPSTTKSLSDAFEGKVFGSYLWINTQNKKYWEVAPWECKVTLPSGEEKQCKSSDEYDALSKAYLE